ncbi:MAG: hypothetical protein WD576_00830 [Nitriliruptoraceae bacterium]
MPTGRAVVGALLIAGAVLGVLAAHSDANAPPETHYIVAAQHIPQGTVVADESAVRSYFGELAVDLVGPVAERSLQLEDLRSLLPFATVGPLEPGDLLSRTLAVDVDALHRHVVTLALPPSRALAGRLTAGEQVNVFATYSRAGDAYTVLVAERVELIAVEDVDSEGFGARDVVLTVAANDPGDIQAVGHAASVANVFLSRPSHDTSADLGVGAMFRPDDVYGNQLGVLPDSARHGTAFDGNDVQTSRPLSDELDPAVRLPLPGVGGVVGSSQLEGERDE